VIVLSSSSGDAFFVPTNYSSSKRLLVLTLVEISFAFRWVCTKQKIERGKAAYGNNFMGIIQYLRQGASRICCRSMMANLYLHCYLRHSLDVCIFRILGILYGLLLLYNLHVSSRRDWEDDLAIRKIVCNLQLDCKNDRFQLTLILQV
jgi:hypothetical protein